MIADKIKELEALKQKTAALEAQVADERRRELAQLPQQFGFASVDDFVTAVLEASGRSRLARRARGSRSGAGRKKGRHPRTKITDEMRAQVKKLSEAGKTGAEIADAVGISLPSVHNIKKALGLVQARK